MKLTEKDFYLIRKTYEESKTADEAQEILSDHFNVSKRTIRKYAKQIGLNVTKQNVISKDKIMIYDIETSRVPAMVWWTGKQFVSGDQLIDDPKIISISYKFLGEDEIYQLTWNDGDDKEMVKEFGEVYSNVTMVIGQNNNNFDNRWVQARLAKFNFPFNTYMRSFDIQKESKRMFRLPSYAMKYMTKFFGVDQKLEHEGIKMWNKIQFGTDDEKKEYLQKMLDYNKGDIISTEALYYRLRKYFGHKVHIGKLNGGELWSCPNCGGENVELYKTSTTAAGSIQRTMKCKDDEVMYKISNRQYLNFIDENKEL